MPQSNSRSHKCVLYMFIWLRRLKWNEHWTESSHRCFDDDDSVVASAALTKVLKVYQLKSISMMIFVHIGSFHSPLAALRTQQSSRQACCWLRTRPKLSTDAYRCVRWAESSEWKQTIENVINVSSSCKAAVNLWHSSVSIGSIWFSVSPVWQCSMRRERRKTCT